MPIHDHINNGRAHEHSVRKLVDQNQKPRDGCFIDICANSSTGEQAVCEFYDSMPTQFWGSWTGRNQPPRNEDPEKAPAN